MSSWHNIIPDNNFQYIRGLLRAGLNPNAADGRGSTLLHIAAFKKEDNIQSIEAILQVVRELIYFGADVNQTDNFGNTPLHFAVCLKNYKMMDIFLKCSAAINLQDDLGNTAMHYAIDSCSLLQWSIRNYEPGHQSKADLEAVELLLSYHPNINICNRLSESPLMWAVNEQNLQIVQILLRNGADHSLRDSFGNEALHYALDVSEIDVDIVTELLRHGCDHASQNNRSESPIDVYLKRLQNASPSEQEKAKHLFKLFVFRENNFNSAQKNKIVNISRKSKTSLHRFFLYCRFEIEQMKDDEISKGYTVYDLASRGFYYDIAKEKSQSIEIFDKILDKLKRGEYNVYNDIIASSICRDYMVVKTAENGYWLDKQGQQVEFLNFDIRYYLCYYLRNFEMLNLMLAFSSTRSFSKNLQNLQCLAYQY